MKEIINDIKKENFSAKECIVYGIIIPLAMVAAVILASNL
jgi:hypothetical protein